MAGQSVSDRFAAARYSIAGQGLAKSVCKATTEEVIGPKKKHLDYLLHCTNEPNVSIPQLANLLVERTAHASWVVVFKALVTVHHLMCYGNERFTQYLASSNSSFQLGSFLDKTNVQGYDMSTFIRRYAKYLNEKAMSYRTVAFDFCKVKRGKDDGILRTMNAEKLLKTVPALQSQIDALLEFDCTANELSNGVINSAFMLLFRDLIRLFACYNDGIINLLEKYFDMNKKMCRDALDIYKKFLIRMDRVAEFLKVAENVGIDKGDIPDLAKAPSSLLDALEQHLAALEGKKGSGAGTPTQPSVKPAYLKSAVTALSNTSSSFVSAAAASGGRDMNGMDEHLQKLALEEEQAALNQHRASQDRRLKELGQSPTGMPNNATNPFLTSPSQEIAGVIDLFEATPSVPSQTGSKMSDDLLCLKSNPFADSILDNNTSQPAAAATTNFQNTNFWGNQNGFAATSANSTTTSANLFASENSFAAVFASNSNSISTGATLTPAPAPGLDMFGDVLQPANAGTGANANQSNASKASPASKVITGDLDSSLASLAQNLEINRGAGSLQNRGGHVWNSPKNTAKTGGNNWAPQMASSTAGWNSPQHAGFNKPMQGGAMTGSVPTASKSADWSGGMAGGAFPQTGGPVPMMGQPQPFMGGARPMVPPMATMGGAGGMGMGMPGMLPPMGMAPAQQPMFNAAAMQPRPPTQASAFGMPQQSAALDPFGAL